MKLYHLLESAFVSVLRDVLAPEGSAVGIYVDHRDTQRELPCITVGCSEPEAGSGRLAGMGLHTVSVMVAVEHAVRDPKDDEPEDCGIDEHDRIADAVHGALAGPHWKARMAEVVAGINANADLGVTLTGYSMPTAGYSRIGARHQTVIAFACQAARR